MDRPRLLHVLEGYGVGQRTLTLLRNFWDTQKIVLRKASYHGPVFEASRGVTQGGLFSPFEFNIVLDAVIRHWLTLVITADGRVAQTGLGPLVADKLAAFYADDGLITATDNDWLQGALDVLVNLFRRCGLQTNVNKTKLMTCFPGAIVFAN